MDHIYIFRIYEERGTTPELYGSPVVLLDNSGDPLTMTDIIALRRSLLTPSTPYGHILTDGDGSVQEYAELEDALEFTFPSVGDDNANRLRFKGFPKLNSDSDAVIAAKESYKDKLESLSGSDEVSEASVRAAAAGSRLSSLIVDLPWTNEYEIGRGIDAATGNETEMKKSVKYSNLSTTLWLHFDTTSQGYEEIPLSVIELTPQAKADISSLSASDLRAKYGDYFIAGARATAQYDAFISIMTNSVEKTQEIKNTLNIGFSKIFSNSTEVSDQVKSSLKETRIDISIKTLGAPQDPSWVPNFSFSGNGDDNDGVPALIDNMKKFMQASMNRSNFDYGTKFYKLRHIKSLPEFSSLPDEIDVEPELFKKLRTMAKLPEISKSVRSVEEWTKKLDAKANEISEISQRWSFYRSLLRKQARERRSGRTLHGYGEWQWGYDSFPWSSVVHNSVFLGRRNDYYSKGKKFLTKRTWTVWNAGLSNGHIFSYIWIKSHSNNDDIVRDLNAIGTNKLKYSFEGGTWRSVEWWLSSNRVDLSDKEKWPFVGL